MPETEIGKSAHPADRDQSAEKAGWKAIDDTVFFQPKGATPGENRQTPWWLLGDSDEEPNLPEPKEPASGDKP